MNFITSALLRVLPTEEKIKNSAILVLLWIFKAQGGKLNDSEVEFFPILEFFKSFDTINQRERKEEN